MISSGVGPFQKQAACPSSKSLLDYRLTKLAPEMAKLVDWHLRQCDFCWSELRLLDHYRGVREGKQEHRSPAMPMNLRVLAEALLFSRRPQATKLRST
jgi:hypothetical protein